MIRNLLMLFLLSLAGSAGAQDAYPSRPVKVIVPWPAGGSNDVAARIVMKAVGESMRQPFVIDNRSGAGGTIGADAVAKSAPDGYTIMVHSGSHIANAFAYKSLPYHTLKDFAPVTTVIAQSMALAVHSGSKARTLKEFLAEAKAQPGKLTISSPGVGSQNHVQIALFEQSAGIQLLHVPYRGGAPQVQGLMGGETEAGIVSVSSIVPAVQSGKVRLIAITSSRRSDLFPAVPTLVEEGVKGLDFTTWVGAFLPAGTPDEIVGKLNTEIAKALQRDDVKKQLLIRAMEPLPMSREEFERLLASDYAKTGKILHGMPQQ
jgi:tripartite-type tricarboxylate transporter receptor subunit TctC